jgi:hypothetical protein
MNDQEIEKKLLLQNIEYFISNVEKSKPQIHQGHTYAAYSYEKDGKKYMILFNFGDKTANKSKISELLNNQSYDMIHYLNLYDSKPKK